MSRSAYAVDPELLAFAMPELDRSDVAAARRAYADRIAAAAPADTDGVHVENLSCTADDGHPIGLRLYRPERRTATGAVCHVHGGGFIVGDLEMSHARNIQIARLTGAVVISVDYRLAPEWPYPTPVDDVYRALTWLHDNAAALDVDPGRIVLHGVSAGGALAASTALLARDRQGPPIALQFLASPVLDDRQTGESHQRFTGTPALTRAGVGLCWSAYLGSAVADAVSAPARSPDLAGLPATYVAVAEFDPLRDDGIDYARSLLRAGVRTELHLFPGTFHGSSVVPGAAISRRERDEEIAVLRRAVDHDPRRTS